MSFNRRMDYKPPVQVVKKREPPKVNQPIMANRKPGNQMGAPQKGQNQGKPQPAKQDKLGANTPTALSKNSMSFIDIASGKASGYSAPDTRSPLQLSSGPGTNSASGKVTAGAPSRTSNELKSSVYVPATNDRLPPIRGKA